MHIIPQAFHSEEIKYFETLWKQKLPDAYVNWIDDRGNLIDHRFIIAGADLHQRSDAKAYDIISKLVNKYFPRSISWWAALQRQTNPHGLHIDEYSNDRIPPGSDIKTWTFIVALETQPLFKAIIFKESSYDNQSMIDQILTKTTRTSNISNREDLEHMPITESKENLADFLQLDGIYTYVEGSSVLFNAKQWHCTSNWKKYPQFTHRDLLQIHVASKEDPVI